MGSPRSRAIRFQGEQAIDHTTDQDGELDAVVVSYSQSAPLPSLPPQDFDPFGSGLGIEGFDKMFDRFTRFDTRAMAYSPSTTPSPAPTPPLKEPRDISSTSPQKPSIPTPSHSDHPPPSQDDVHPRALPLPPHSTRAYTAPALTPINTQLEEDDFQPVLDAESSIDHSALERKPTLNIPHGSLVFPVPRPFMRPRALSTSAIGSPETVNSVISPPSEYSQYTSGHLLPLLPVHPDPIPRSHSAQAVAESGTGPVQSEPTDPTPPESVLSVRSQVPFTGYTEDHIAPLGAEGGYDTAKLFESSYAPPRLAIQAATPQTPTRVGFLPIPKKGSLTNIAGMFSFNPSSSPLGRTSPKKSQATPQPVGETYAAATVRLKREKMALDLAMNRKARRDGSMSAEQTSPEDIADWEKELRAIDAERKQRTIKEERRRSQDWKDKERKRKSDMLRMVYGWQDDVQ